MKEGYSEKTQMLMEEFLRKNYQESNSKLRNLVLRSFLEDLVDFVGYFTGIPMPTNTVGAIGSALVPFISSKLNDYSRFLDWELKNWPEIYSKELNRCLYLPSIFERYKGRILIPFVLLYEGTKINYDVSRLLFIVEDEVFTIPPDIEDKTYKFYRQLRLHLQRKFKFYNALNMRLKSCWFEKDFVFMKVQPVAYESYVHTNLVLDAMEADGESLRMYLHKNGKLESLESSPLANNLGINFLVFTSGGYLSVVRRSENVAFRRGEFCPSASGTISFFDFCGRKEVRGNKQLFLRELEEELGITVNDVKKMEFLGIARDLVRGGEPELFFWIKTDLSREQILERSRIAKDKFEVEDMFFFDFKQYGILNSEERKDICRDEYSEFLALLKKFLYTYKEALSLNLLASIALWERSFCRQS